MLFRSIVQATSLDSPGRSIISGSRINHCELPAEASTAPGSEAWMCVPDPTSTDSARSDRTGLPLKMRKASRRLTSAVVPLRRVAKTTTWRARREPSARR